MQDFPANSQKAKTRSEEPKKIERVTSVEAERRKKGLGRRFKDTFIGSDPRATADYVFLDVIIPAVRDMMFDAFEAGLQRMIYGESTRHRRGGPPSGYPANVGRVDYSRISTARQAKPPTSRMLSRRSRALQNFEEIVISSRQEAEEVIDRMFDILSRYGMVTVAELYEMTGITSSHTDNKWGWTALRGAKVARLRSGDFLLDLPEPEPLD